MSNEQGRAAAVVLAGGSGTRLGADRNKVFVDLQGRPMLAWSLATLDRHPAVSTIVVAVRAGDEEAFTEALRSAEKYGGPMKAPVLTVPGGATRSASELAALDRLAPYIEDEAVEVVLIHDGARPFADEALITRTISAALAHRGAVPGLMPDRQVFELDADAGHASALRIESLRRVQTPQAFAAKPLLAAYRQAQIEGFEGVDTAEVVARFAEIDAVVVDGDPENIKVTTVADLHRAHRIAARRLGDGRWAQRRSP